MKSEEVTHPEDFPVVYPALTLNNAAHQLVWIINAMSVHGRPCKNGPESRRKDVERVTKTTGMIFQNRLLCQLFFANTLKPRTGSKKIFFFNMILKSLWRARVCVLFRMSDQSCFSHVFLLLPLGGSVLKSSFFTASCCVSSLFFVFFKVSTHCFSNLDSLFVF